jgi:hypothetical protein
LNANSARKFFAAALALYVLWVATLATLAFVSGARPTTDAIRRASDPTTSRPDNELLNE